MGKHPPKVCGICGKEETTGWTSHKQRHKVEVVFGLIEGEQPKNPKHKNWFDRLSSHMQNKYAASKPTATNDIFDKTSLSEEK